MIDRLRDAIRSFGANGARVRDWSLYVAESRRSAVGTKDNETGNAHAPMSFSESCGARYLLVWNDGKVSRGYLERTQVETSCDEALAQAREAAYEDPDAAHVLGPAPVPDVELHDPAAAKLASGGMAAAVPRLRRIREVAAESGFRTWSGSLGATETRAELQTSEGLKVSGVGTSFGWHVVFDGEWGDGFTGRAPDGADEHEQRLDRLALTVRLLGKPADPLAPGERSVLLHPGVVERYVLGTLLGNLDGATVWNGEGRFRREDFGSGKALLREDLTLRLDPLVPLRSGSYRFTVEGLPAARCTFVSRGRLLQPILDVKYARRLGRKPTPPPYDMDTLFLEGPEPLAPEEAWGSADALVLSVLGIHTQDPASGDFSLSAPQCLRIGDGGPVGRLRATLSGNLWSVLQSPDLALVRFPGEHTPGLLFRCRLDS